MATLSYSDNLTVAESSQVPDGFMASVLDTAQTNQAADDIWEALSVPAGAIVSQVGLVVLTAEGGTLTIDVGDSDVDGFLDGVNVNSAGAIYNSLSTGTPAYTAGKYFSSADTIDCKFINAADAAKILVWAKFHVVRTDYHG